VSVLAIVLTVVGAASLALMVVLLAVLRAAARADAQLDREARAAADARAITGTLAEAGAVPRGNRFVRRGGVARPSAEQGQEGVVPERPLLG
jgi:hypothetical protein